MKIAFCLSGQPRTSKEIFQNHKQLLLKGIDTFAHLWWHNSHMGKVIRYHASERYPNYDLSAEMIEAYKPLKFFIEDYIDFDQGFWVSHNYETWGKDLPQKFYDIFTPFAIYSLLCQSYSAMCSSKMCHEYNEHDISARVRADALFIRDDLLKILNSINVKDNEIYFQSSMSGGHLYSGEHPNNPCDWFYCGTPKSVSHFSETWYNSIKEIYKKGVIHNSESLRIVAKNANLNIKLHDFGCVVKRQIQNKDPHFVPYQKYLEDFDEKNMKIDKNIEEWPFWVKHVKFRKI